MYIMSLKVENKWLFPLIMNIEEPFPLLYSLKPSDGTQKKKCCTEYHFTK